MTRNAKQEDRPAKPLPPALSDLVTTLHQYADKMREADNGDWWRYAAVLDMLLAARELIATDPDYNGRIRFALDLADAAVTAQRADGEYRRLAAQKDDH